MKRIYNLEAFEWANTGPASHHEVVAFEPCVVRRIKMVGDLEQLIVTEFWIDNERYHAGAIPAMVFSPLAVVPVGEGIVLETNQRIGITVVGTGRFKFGVEVEAEGPCRCPSCKKVIVQRSGPVHWFHWLCAECRTDFELWRETETTKIQFDSWMSSFESMHGLESPQ